jgi:hypothetical protein
MEFCLLHYSITPILHYPLAAAWLILPRVYPLLGLCAGYLLVLLFNPVRLALRDGFRCILRFPRIWITFVIFGFAYSIFQFAIFSPVQSPDSLDWNGLTSPATWNWPKLLDVWKQTPLPTLENIAGIFDNATTTYPLSVVAAILIIGNWRGLHSALFNALRRRFRLGGFLIYLIVLISAVASLVKPIIFSRLPAWAEIFPAAELLRFAAVVDAVAFVFEYLFGIYIQVYLIMVCFAWIRGLSFEEGELFRFAVRRFSFVLKWAGIIVLVSTVIVRLPLVVASLTDNPQLLEYLPFERLAMSLLIISFASVQVSLALHNEGVGDAIRAHGRFLRRNWTLFGWFLLVCALHFFLIMALDAVARGAIGERLIALMIWKCFFVAARGFITGWLLASWVCLFRHCETSALGQERWIQY